MKSTFRILFYVKRDKPKADGTLPVMCRITIDGQQSRFNTKASVNPTIWDAKAAVAIGKSNEAVEVNSLLNTIKTSIYNVYHDLLTKENNVNAERVKNIFLGVEVKHQTVLELFQRHNEDIAKLVGISKSKETYQKYEVARKRMAGFIKEYYNASDISLKDVNHMFLHNFEIYLMTTCNCKENTTAKFLQRFRTIIILAKNNGWIHIDPFANFKIKFKKTDRGYLTQQEIDIIMQKKFASERLERVRDIFIFSCFTGLRYSDVFNLKRSDLKNNHIEVTTIKTADSLIIELNDHSRAILDKYKDVHFEDDKVLPVISNQKMNDYLKELAKLAEIDEPVRETYYKGNERIDKVTPKHELLGTHAGRRTFICNALSLGIAPQVVMKWTGHSDYKAIKPYIDIADDIKASAMDKFNQL